MNIEPHQGQGDVYNNPRLTKQTQKQSTIILACGKWYVRLWRMITNPFTYIFQGKIRY